MIITRRSLLASLGLALPVAVAATGASASTRTGRTHHLKTHAMHAQRHGKLHHTAMASAHPHTRAKHI